MIRSLRQKATKAGPRKHYKLNVTPREMSALHQNCMSNSTLALGFTARRLVAIVSEYRRQLHSYPCCSY